jgi:hypothetical protein
MAWEAKARARWATNAREDGLKMDMPRLYRAAAQLLIIFGHQVDRIR